MHQKDFSRPNARDSAKTSFAMEIIRGAQAGRRTPRIISHEGEPPVAS